MNKNNLVKIIGRELSILTDFVNEFGESENIHPMEVDLALSKAKDIYNELLLLKGADRVSDIEFRGIEEEPKGRVEAKNIEKEPNYDELKVASTTLIVEPIIPIESTEKVKIEEEPLDEAPITTEVIEVIEPDKTIEAIENETQYILPDHIKQAFVTSPIIKEEKAVEAIVNPEIETKLPERIVEIKPKKGERKASATDENIKGETIADKYLKESFSINDRLASIKSNNDLVSLLKGTPITDLKKAIKLNDRVWFTNELFNKNSATFEKAVDTVNNSTDLDSALKYLLENFNWNQELKSTISFLELVFRRFPAK